MTLTITETEPRSWKQAMARGFMLRCPNCGKGPLFTSYLKVAPSCSHCGEELHHQRADDAPPYFTMMIVGHIIVPSMLIVEKLWHPALAIHFVVWTLATFGLTFSLMPSVKGAVVGLQWALRMHGFDTSAPPRDGE